MADRVVAERFELQHVAGTGGMGQVYRALDRAAGATVAVKFLRDDQGGVGARFDREARLLASLQHPHIVRYIAHGVTSEGEMYLAMEWLEGEDLESRLRQGPLSVEESIAVAARTAEALAIAHAQGVVHRDLKPSNLFLPGKDPRAVKLLDFGIARLREGRTLATAAGAVIGTPGYMSPEQARGEAGVDARTDVFSLGCVLYECLTGGHAFAGEHVVAILAKVLFEDPPAVRSVRPEVPDAVAAVLERMLAKSAGQRPKDAAAVVEQLALAGRAPPNTGPAPAPRLTAVEQRRLFVVMASARAADAAAGETAPTAEAVLPVTSRSDLGAARARLRDVAIQLGARLEWLVDGSLVATVTAIGSATDAAARAARCALALRAELPGSRIVLATGRGVVDRALPLGEVIDRAASLLRVAPGPKNAVALDEGTAGLLGLHFQVEGDARGLHLIEEREQEESVRTLLGRPTPCVGRDRELGLLAGILNECANEPVARAALVIAPPGQGKSRLRHEFLKQVGERASVWLARGDAMSAGSPFVMLGQLIRGAAGIQEGEEIEVRRRRLRARVARHVPAADAGRVARFLGEMAGVPFADDDDVQLRAARADAQVMGDQMLRAFETWVRAECAAQPVLIVLEDLHWGDVPTVKQLDFALRRLREEPLMVLALARPEVHDIFPGLWSERGMQEIRLPELSRKASERLARIALGTDAADDVIARLAALSAGNAFYLEELIRAVAEHRDAELPETVLAMVQVRYEGLEPEARQLLRAASVLGEVFWKGAVLELIGDPALRARQERWLGQLCERELVEPRAESRFKGESEYAFRHALLREGAYAALTDADRKLGHRLAAEWLERAGESDAAAIAGHLQRAGENARASGWYRRAAEQALGGGDLPAALERARRAIECGAAGDDLVQVHLLQLEALKWKGARLEMEQVARELVETQPAGSAAWCKALAEVAGGTGLRFAEDALLQLDPAMGSSPHWVVCLARVLSQSSIQRRHARLGVLFEALERQEPEDPAVRAWKEQAQAFRAAALGDLGATLRHFRAARADFEKAGDLRNALAQVVDEGFTLAELGLYAELKELMEGAIPALEGLGLLRLLGSACCNLGLALARMGDPAEGVRRIEAGIAMFSRQHLHWGIFGIYLVTALRLKGDLDAAEEAARRSIEAVREIQQLRGWDLTGSLAQVLLDRGRAREAYELTREELPSGASILSDSEQGFSLRRLTRVAALQALGETEQARTETARAVVELEARAARIREPELRASYLGAVPAHAQLLALARELGVR